MATPTFEPSRDQWLGRRNANPAAAVLQEGDWWYREDLNVFCYWDGNMVHCWGGVGGIMFYGTQAIVCQSAGDYRVNVTLDTPWVPVVINRIVSIYNIDTDPDTDPGTPMGVRATAPVIGMTLIGVGHGTTLTTGVVAMGW